ncbi:hypothetical protein V8F06_013021 [Rhypophila decipiens]
MAPLLEFHPFLRLPPELRLIIWESCLPRRVIRSEDNYYWSRGSSTYWNRINRWMPVLAHVCRESRWVVFRQGCCFRDGVRRTQEEALKRWDSVSLPISNNHPRTRRSLRILQTRKQGSVLARGNDPWYQPGLDVDDVVYLEWSPEDTPAGEQHCLDQLASFITEPNAGDGPKSIKLEVFFPYRRAYGSMARHLSTALQLAILSLKRHPEYYVILGCVDIYVKKSAATRSGLFGHLGDEPIQPVDPRDKSALEGFLLLLKNHGDNDQSIRSRLNRLSRRHGASTVFAVDRLCSALTKLWIILCIWTCRLDPFRQHPPLWGSYGSTPVQYGNTQSFEPVPQWWMKEFRTLVPNRKNEWVMKTINEMPKFHPKIMIRLVTRS